MQQLPWPVPEHEYPEFTQVALIDTWHTWGTVALWPALSVTVIANVYAAAVVGVPSSFPVLVLRARPLGMLP